MVLGICRRRMVPHPQPQQFAVPQDIRQQNRTGRTRRRKRSATLALHPDRHPSAHPRHRCSHRLKAEIRASSVLLTWEKADATAPTYTVLRSENPEEGYEIIARYVEDTAFVDNKAEEGKTYYYTVKTVDASMNTSPASLTVSASVAPTDALFARYEFEENLHDTTLNIRHGVMPEDGVYTEGKSGQYALALDGSGQYVNCRPTWPTMRKPPFQRGCTGKAATVGSACLTSETGKTNICSSPCVRMTADTVCRQKRWRRTAIRRRTNHAIPQGMDTSGRHDRKKMKFASI